MQNHAKVNTVGEKISKHNNNTVSGILNKEIEFKKCL